MVKRIKFHISSEGEISLDVEGTVGAQCEDLTAPFEKILGTTGRRERKDSYYAEVDQFENHKIRGGD